MRSADSAEQHSHGVPAPLARRRRLPQISLLTLLLFSTALCVWIAYFVSRQRNFSLELRVNTTRYLLPELRIYEPHRIAVMKFDELWTGDNRWKIYLPPHSRYRLCMATRGIVATNPYPVQNGRGPGQTFPVDPNFRSAVEAYELEDGVHVIELEKERVGDSWTISVRQDGKVVLKIEELNTWGSTAGETKDGHQVWSWQYSDDLPLILLRSRFLPSAPATSNGPIAGDGILLWIEKVKD